MLVCKMGDASLARRLKFGVAIVVLQWGVTSAEAEGEILPVPRAVIYSGDTILAAALIDRSYERPATGGLPRFATRDTAIGKVARRTLLPGQPIPLDAVRSVFVIVQGQPTTLTYEHQGLRIIGKGIALQSASVGEFIRVRLPQFGTIVVGRVNSDLSVTVDGG
jgi:flagellar basal body P-ring formation protein FlgA